jgi:hypothetical protein
MIDLRRISTTPRAAPVQPPSLAISLSRQRASRALTRKRAPNQSSSFRMRGLARLSSEHSVEYCVLEFELPIRQSLFPDVFVRVSMGRTVCKTAYCQHITVCRKESERDIRGSLSDHKMNSN